MRIAITSDIYWPMMNGVAVFLHNLAIGLKKSGHEVLIIHPSPDGEPRTEVDENGVKSILLKSHELFIYPDQIADVPPQKEFLGMKVPRVFYKDGLHYSLFPYAELSKALDEFQPDVIHLQTAELVAMATLKYARRHHIALVSTGHAYPDNITSQLKPIAAVKPLKYATDAVLKLYMASYLMHSEYATMPTEVAIEELIPKRWQRRKVPVEALSNGVDLTRFKPGKSNQKILEKFGLDTQKQRILYVGRVDPEKSISNVVEAFGLVAKRLPRAELVIVGDGIDMSHLKEVVREDGLGDRVRFLGRVFPPDLVDIYRSSSLFATASETETQGIVLIEASATGLPLVAVDAGAVRELCQSGVNGELCQPGDIEEMAAAMEKILTNDELQKKYAKAAIAVAKKHDLKQTIKRFEEIYQEAIDIKAQQD
jgi:glycosyltransferase involved in cell wall biosynthesis